MSESFSSIDWRWVPRQVNHAAHNAAAIGIRAAELERPPPSLVRVLNMACLALPCYCLFAFGVFSCCSVCPFWPLMN